ncbi:DUF3107 domain-containing protein [Nocardioides sp. B-3]|uniref:DUF3107 domain-containing protein n=1 Tax=Nocardioides sp. B-3 TaxID=2895565 RepID=UPI00215219B4|nr:DUF3107 domain-containing protein [Nocardioides sp. B-3]UUZ58166.1 DUF3107 domain-containing protein [Nocardioides sp. B-3]
MEVKIGVQHAPRELVVETDVSPEDFEAQLARAVEAGSLLAFTDTKGRRVAVAGNKIAYVEIGTGTHGTVGFR